MIPSFRHMGGKARLRKWLVNHFPKNGICYMEVFCGKGNVYFHAAQELKYSWYALNDIDNSFLSALYSIDTNLLPQTVCKEDFEKWKTDKGEIAKVIEPRITFAGKGYAYGYSGTSGIHVGYTKENYKKVCDEAQRILKTYPTTLLNHSWDDEQLYVGLGRNDFVYFDPPYLGTTASYGNIDHEKLIKFLNSASFRWAVSGYDTTLYDSLKYTGKYQIERNSEIKSSNKGQKSGVMEVLWTNY